MRKPNKGGIKLFGAVIPDPIRCYTKPFAMLDQRKVSFIEDISIHLLTSRLLLAGMMIDRAEIETGETEISLKLYKDQFE